MNRRIIIDPARESFGWRLATSIAVFIFALAVCALLSVDGWGPQRPSTTEVEP